MPHRFLEFGSAPPLRQWTALLACLVLVACGGTRIVERFCEIDCQEDWEAECEQVCDMEAPESTSGNGGNAKPRQDSGKSKDGETDSSVASELDAGQPDAAPGNADAMVATMACPTDCPKALCDPVTGECMPCAADVDCKAPRDICLEGTCVACASEDHCDDEARPVCDPERFTCVGCFEHSDCKDPSKSHCQDTACVSCQSDRDCHDPSLPQCSEGTCVGCTSDAQCAHFPLGSRVCNPDRGACVECTGQTPDACRGRVCDALSNSCTDIEPQTAEACEACVSDAQCDDGLHCVKEQFGSDSESLELGFVCMPVSETGPSCAEGGQYNRLYTGERNVDGEMVSTCHPRATTCQALDDFLKPCADDAGVPDDSACGVPGLEDGFCISDAPTSPSETYRCTVGCSRRENECSPEQHCQLFTTWQCTW